LFNIASKNTVGKINKNEIKAAFTKLIPNFPRDLVTDLFAELPAQISKESFLVFFN